MSRVRVLPCLALLACCVAAGASPARAALPRALPAGWPSHLLVGMRDEENGAADLRARSPLEARYHYLSGGVNTGRGWTTWATGDGSFVTNFITDSSAWGFLPVLSLYQLRPSLPGAADPDEKAADLANLASVETMRQYLSEARLLFQRAGQTGVTTILHVEPDLWGYAQVASEHGDPAAVRAQVSSTGLPELAGLPNTIAGLAQAFVRLRDAYARNVELAYHVSVWGTGEDIARQDSSDARVDELAAQAARWYKALGARFDLVFSEVGDRDAGYAETLQGDPGAWWTPEDYARHVRFLARLATAVDRRIVVWQVPLGNKVMRSMDDTPFHYRDDRVQWLLGNDYRSHLRAYADAGVIGFLFGAAQPTSTCACDAAGDGVTNPPGPGLPTTSPDDDGGYFKSRVAAYYKAGPLALPGVVKPPARAQRRTKAPRLRVSARTSRRTAARGTTVTVTTTVTAAGPASTLVAVQLYGPRARKYAAQRAFPGQRLRTRVPRRLRWTYTVPADAARGSWRVKVGVFDPDWRTRWAWNEDAATFTVR